MADKEMESQLAGIPKDMITDALAAELGIENRGDNNRSGSDAAEDFWKEAEQAFAADQHESAERQRGPVDTPVEGAGDAGEKKWVHEPTGRTFESEIDMLRFETGWKSNQIGELRAANEAYQTVAGSKKDGNADEKPMDPKEMNKRLVAIALQDTGIDPDEAGEQFGLVAKMTDNILSAYHLGVSNKIDQLNSLIEQMKNERVEERTIQSSGLNMEVVQDVLKKHPGLASLPPDQRVAVVRDLVKTQGTGEQPKSTLHQRLQPSMAGHVEGSVSNAPPDTERDPFAKFWKLSEKEKLQALGSWFENSEIGEHIRDAHMG